ncbi:MAG: DNA double-strand break repair nuclease NurA [Pseudanabaenaceae cyanobacterium SKYGB_i_bin29]|nr:DNA double-strand break repair nuclease NurA [Pseudanabaenaceae cyanobacterium SKYG29]MDW8421305.1 DNA double-strand break repair nuclease NurA [Pseudanabaenaceae cyanobacterium SKYGB_i_bin29]
MLNFVKLSAQMAGMSSHLAEEVNHLARKGSWALSLLDELQQKQTELQDKFQSYRSGFPFTCATPVDLSPHLVSPLTSPHTVIATDGSQIAPSRHEIAYCYLINIGRVVLHYGTGEYPTLDSVPEIYYKATDLAKARQWGISPEEWMGLQRRVAEVKNLTELCLAHTRNTPLLALEDGSLIHWYLEAYPAEARREFLTPILACWDELAARRVPLVGYVSAPRSVEITNFLRLLVCPYGVPECTKHCSHLALEDAPCSKLHPLRDATLWQKCLPPGYSCGLWRSQARILEEYGDHSIYVTYLNIGDEIARLEMPAWTALDPYLRQQALSIVYAQVQKGYGYPVALAEAHNQAVVTSSDRRRFFLLLEQQLIKSGLTQIGVSLKETRKRRSIA